MAKVLVVGYGNPLRTDDSFGWRVAEQLQQKITHGDVEITQCHQLLPELAEKVARVDLVIFIDASTDGVGGNLRFQRVKPAPKVPGTMSHHLDAPGLLAAVEAAYHVSPEAVMVTVTGECFGYSRELTPVVAATIPGVVEHLRVLIDDAVAADASRFQLAQV